MRCQKGRGFSITLRGLDCSMVWICCQIPPSTRLLVMSEAFREDLLYISAAALKATTHRRRATASRFVLLYEFRQRKVGQSHRRGRWRGCVTGVRPLQALLLPPPPPPPPHPSSSSSLLISTERLSDVVPSGAPGNATHDRDLPLMTSHKMSLCT